MLRKGDLVKWCSQTGLGEQVFGVVLENQKQDSKRILVHFLGDRKPVSQRTKWVQLVSRGNQG
jgi:hypothetical protein